MEACKVSKRKDSNSLEDQVGLGTIRLKKLNKQIHIKGFYVIF